MTLTTLSGVYENSRRLLFHLGPNNVSHLAQQLKTIADDQKKLTDLSIALDNLEQHIRVLGLEVVVLEEKP